MYDTIGKTNESLPITSCLMDKASVEHFLFDILGDCLQKAESSGGMKTIYGSSRFNGSVK